MTLGERIAMLRKQKGYSQQDLAKLLGISKQAVGKYESGIVDNPPLYRLEKIAAVLGTTPKFLAGWEEPESVEKLTPKDELSAVKAELIELVKSLSEEECQAVLRILKR